MYLQCINIVTITYNHVDKQIFIYYNELKPQLEALRVLLYSYFIRCFKIELERSKNALKVVCSLLAPFQVPRCYPLWINVHILHNVREHRDPLILIAANTQSWTARLRNITRSSKESFTADFCDLLWCFCLYYERQRGKVTFAVQKERER